MSEHILLKKRKKEKIVSLVDVIENEDPATWLQKVKSALKPSDFQQELGKFYGRECNAEFEVYVKFLAMKALLHKTGNEDMLSPSQPIDEIWHFHILYTRSYAETCINLCGEMIDHSPRRSINRPSREDRLAITRTLLTLWFKEKPSTMWFDPDPPPLALVQPALVAFRLIVRPMTDWDMHIACTEHDTHTTIVQKLAAKYGIADDVNSVRLLHKGQELEHDTPLKTYGIIEEAVIRLIFKLRGC